MKVKFAYQISNRHDEDIEKFFSACNSIGIKPIGYGLISDELEVSNFDEFSKHEIVIPFGSTKMLRTYQADAMPSNCLLWYDENRFDQEFYRHRLKDLLLNHDARYSTYGKVKHMRFDYPVFMKPSKDLKEFDGILLYPEETLEREISNGRRSKYLTDESGVLYAPEKPIEKEFRCFVVNGDIIDISSYKANDKVQWTVPTEEERNKCVEFFQQVSEKYAPEACYVVDFCLTNGIMKVVEYNCFHCSGFYTVDIAKILKSLISYMENLT